MKWFFRKLITKIFGVADSTGNSKTFLLTPSELLNLTAKGRVQSDIRVSKKLIEDLTDCYDEHLMFRCEEFMAYQKGLNPLMKYINHEQRVSAIKEYYRNWQSISQTIQSKLN